MEMKKEEQKIIKYHIEKDNQEYYIYQIPNDNEDNGLTGFYIQKKDYGLITYCIGIYINQLAFPVEDFIKDHINDWILLANIDLEKNENGEV